MNVGTMGKRQGLQSRAELRSRAEQRVAAQATKKAAAAPADPARLLHELEVHQVELEMQNEELYEARAQVEHTLERYKELFDFAPIGYVVLDAEGDVLEVNLESARLVGATRAALQGKRFANFIALAHRKPFADFLVKVLTASDSERLLLEVELPQNEGESLQVRLIASGLDRMAGRAALVAIHDVTARKRAEAALRDEVLRRDDFLATLSHELRNPLAPIRTGLAILDRVEPGSEPAVHARAAMGRQVDHLVAIVDDLLDVTRIARGKVRLQRGVVDLAEIVRHTAQDYRPSFEAHEVALTYGVPKDPVVVNADATRMTQVLSNLLGNALKFTRRGGHVEVLLRAEGEQAVLAVRDDGLGIAPAVRARLFEPFMQAPQSLERPGGGLGLGLAMVKGLVLLHGGTVDASSGGLGKGAEFTIRLPRVVEAKEPRDARSLPFVPPPSSGELPALARRVLVIEDSFDAGDILRDLLVSEGHEVQVAHDGPSGIRLAREFHPDVVLCDIGLPGMNGYQIARAMLADPDLRESRLVALSGYARPEDQRRARDAGFHDHVAKPISMTALHKALTL
jgi:PAS domain S-box-containing protein